MSFQPRVLAGLVGLLLLTVVGAWLIAGGGVVRPLVSELADERLEVAVYVAEQVASAEQPRERAAELAEELGLGMRLLDDDEVEHLDGRRGHDRRRGDWQEREHDGHTVRVRHGRRAPVLVGMGPDGAGPPWLAVRFRGDVEGAPRRVGLGLGVLACVVLLGAVGVSRWVGRPLAMASDAMNRVAEGDLDHRVPAGTGNDPTARIARSFNQMAAQVQTLVDTERELLASVSHELRTPLTRLGLQLALLRDDGAPATRVARMEADLAELDALVGELLESARLDQGAAGLDRQDTPIRPVIDRALEAVDPAGRPVHIDVPDGLRAHVDGVRLGRAVGNLLANAIRYTPPETPIWVRATSDEDAVVVVVEDAGPGVPRDALPKLFHAFYRTEASRDRRTGGLGLGLKLVRQIAEAHGGTATADLRDGGGLRVTLRLPLRAPSGSPR